MLVSLAGLGPRREHPIPKDIVCDLSQGKIEGGQFACTMIAVEAAWHIASGAFFETKQDITNTLEKGVKLYTAYQTKKEKTKPAELCVEEAVKFHDLLHPDHVLKVFEPPRIKGFGFPARDASSSLLDVPLSGITEGHLVAHLDALWRAGPKRAAVLTLPGHSVMVCYRDIWPLLFDSAGKSYGGEDLGASFLRFNSAVELVAHVGERYDWMPGGEAVSYKQYNICYFSL